jgi:hypothetical protein
MPGDGRPLRGEVHLRSAWRRHVLPHRRERHDQVPGPVGRLPLRAAERRDGLRRRRRELLRRLRAWSVRRDARPLGRPTSCAAVVQTCVADADCPAGYACSAGACRDGSCSRRPDCPAGGQCVFPPGDTVGTCVCSGCGGLDCPLGCRDGFYLSGCICTTIDDCPPEDDVCFMGAC